MSIDRYLEDLESRLDGEIEEALYESWREFADGRFTGELFSPRRARPAPSYAVVLDFPAGAVFLRSAFFRAAA